MTVQPSGRRPPWEIQSAFLEVDDVGSGKSFTVCLDLRDGHDLGAPRRRDLADVIFKRSLGVGGDIDGHPDVRPYGLVFQCRNDREPFLRWLALGTLKVPYGRGFSEGLRLHRAALQPFFRAVANHVLPASARLGLPRELRVFEALPTDSAEPVVLFQTKAWDPEQGADPEDRDAVNEQRAAVIRSLRAALGGKFWGGFVPSTFARERYPDCLTTLATDQRGYMDLVRRSAIVVTTRGLHGSTPFKLAEYLASSRAIVSDVLTTRQPRPLQPDLQMVVFNSPQECADVCARLLSQPERLRALREEAHRYYLDEVRPDALLRNRLVELTT